MCQHDPPWGRSRAHPLSSCTCRARHLPESGHRPHTSHLPPSNEKSASGAGKPVWLSLHFQAPQEADLRCRTPGPWPASRAPAQPQVFRSERGEGRRSPCAGPHPPGEATSCVSGRIHTYFLNQRNKPGLLSLVDLLLFTIPAEGPDEAAPGLGHVFPCGFSKWMRPEAAFRATPRRGAGGGQAAYM